MEIVRDVLSLALVSSGLVGMQILAYDKWLWFAEPSHAYGLLGFVAVDLVLAIALLWRVHLGTIGAGVMSATQFGAMLADAVAGQPSSVPAVAFRSYLLNDTSYIGLLLIQLSILAIVAATLSAPLLHRHGRWTTIFHLKRH